MYSSYCRFEGTRMELDACLAEVEEHVNGDSEYPVSESEVGYFWDMVKDFVGWLHDMALLDNEGHLNEDALDDMCEDMTKARRDEDNE